MRPVLQCFTEETDEWYEAKFSEMASMPGRWCGLSGLTQVISGHLHPLPVEAAGNGFDWMTYSRREELAVMVALASRFAHAGVWGPWRLTRLHAAQSAGGQVDRAVHEPAGQH